MEDIASSEIIDIRVFKFNELLSQERFKDIDEVIRSDLFFIGYIGNNLSVNPFNYQKKFMAVQVKIGGKSVFRTYPLYLFHLFESVNKTYEERKTKRMILNKNIAVKYNFEEFSSQEAEFFTDMIHLAVHTACLYKNLPMFSSTWSKIISRNDFKLIMLAGRHKEINYWVIAHISECLFNKYIF
ncbi:hypothetical protein HZS_5715 [Henneguya salminicola]|nr:hypothetical protein HZS_5715 [Henneguya salminicola]